MKRPLASLAALSFRRVAELLAEPWRVDLALNAPAVVTHEEALAVLFPGVTAETLAGLRRCYIGNHPFHEAVATAMVAARDRRPVSESWREFLYVTVRLARPGRIVETGVFDGESSAVILLALADNGRGTLTSIDLPAHDTIAGSTDRMRETRLPPGRQPGWIVPDALRARHRLLLGDSREILPRVLAEDAIDLFFHDSLHTYEHQSFEYETAWPRLRDGGMLLSDDITWNAAFHHFCRRVGRPYLRVEGGRFGALRK